MDLRTAAELLCRKALELADFALALQGSNAPDGVDDGVIEVMLDRVGSVNALADRFRPAAEVSHG